MKPQLFLLKPDFLDARVGAAEARYYCPHCVYVEGILSYYPELRKNMDVHYVDFERPRTPIVARLGTEHQFCPSLVIQWKVESTPLPQGFQRAGDFIFSNDEKAIADQLAELFAIGRAHP